MTTKHLASFCLSSFLLIATAGCAHKKPVQVWRFNHCATNGGHIVCECIRFHTELNAATGDVVRVCD